MDVGKGGVGLRPCLGADSVDRWLLTRRKIMVSFFENLMRRNQVARDMKGELTDNTF